MKSALILTAISLLATAVHGSVAELESRDTTTGGYVQNPQGTASFAQHTGCATPACGRNVTSGYSAAMSQLAFGAPPGLGPGDACGRCFHLTAEADPFSNYTGPFNTIIAKVTNLCGFAENGTNAEWCSQTQSNPTNQHGMAVHFDLCTDTGAAQEFFPAGKHALTGFYEEVPCDEWFGTDGPDLWDGACLQGENAPSWPATACGNQGKAP